jgi:hypothetical protein
LLLASGGMCATAHSGDAVLALASHAHMIVRPCLIARREVRDAMRCGAARRGRATKSSPAVGRAYRRRRRLGRPWRRRTSRIADDSPLRACSSTINQTIIESAYDMITRSVTECMPTSHIQCRTHEQATSSVMVTYFEEANNADNYSHSKYKSVRRRSCSPSVSKERCPAMQMLLGDADEKGAGWRRRCC